MNEGILQVLSAQEVMDKEAQEQATNAGQQSLTIDSLSQYIDKKWADAKDAKVIIEEEMLKSLLQRKGEYDPIKLSEIRSAEQPEIFMNITDTKCRNAVAWIKDIFFQTGKRIFSVTNSPIPELPPEIADRIQQEVVQGEIQVAVQQMVATGIRPDAQMVQQAIAANAEEIQEKVLQEIIHLSRRFSEKIERQIDDDWTQGGYYEALHQVIDDVISLKAGIMKGPVFRKVKIRTVASDPQTGRMGRQVVEKIVPQYERRSSFSIYPSPRSTGIDNGYLFDVIVLRPKQLYDLIGVPGYSEKDIRDALKEFYGGQLKNDWLSLSQEALDGMGEDDPLKSVTQYPDENIYCLELWDDIPGNLLKEWGLQVEDEEAEYSCCCWKVGNHVIKAMLNYDMLGRKPYVKASFQTVNDSFWGRSLPELIADCQQICNACARSILSNIGMGALPQVALNVDRLEPNAPRKIWPGRIWPVTDEQMASGNKAVEFFQPVMITEKLMNVYTVFSKIADEHSGVPAYAHGDSQVGGAGSTASGLNQLITQAARGIKAVIRNIDLHIIEPSLQMHYDYLLDNQEIYGLIGDYNMVAKGTETLVAKEQIAQRKIEFMAQTANPIDLQLIGIENRRKMLYEVAKSLGIEIDEEMPPPTQPPVQLQGQGQVPPEGSQNLDEAGNPVGGTSERQFSQEPQGGEPPIREIPENRAGGGAVQAGRPYIVGEQGPELVVPQQDAWVHPNQTRREDWGKRGDGSPKGRGYLGVQKMTDGSDKDITEMSVGVNIDGRDMEIPTVVPTLTLEEYQTLKAGLKPSTEIINKAVKHAKERMKENKSPYYD